MDIADLTRRILDRREREDSALRIVQAGHPALRRDALSAAGKLPGPLLGELVAAMTLTMREAPGVGLAAPQIGLPLRLFVIEDRHGSEPGRDPAGDRLERRPVTLRALADPAVGPLGTERVYAWEGCLSVDGWQSIVPRSRRMRVTGLDVGPDGSLTPIDEEHTGWPARILAHETDHLAGVLCHDLMVPRSFVEAGYAARYEQMPEAVRRLGLSGEITRLGGDQVSIG